MKEKLSFSTLDAAMIGLPTRGAVIDTQDWMDVDGIDGKPVHLYRVMGHICSVDPNAQDIHFCVNIPENWNGKLIAMGGMAYNGFVTTGETGYSAYDGIYGAPLESGYATCGSDSGHTADFWDPSFAENDEQFLNYAYAHIKKMKDVSCEIIRDLTDKLPD